MVEQGSLKVSNKKAPDPMREAARRERKARFRAALYERRYLGLCFLFPLKSLHNHY